MKNARMIAVVIGVVTLLSGLPASAQDPRYNFTLSSGFYAGNAKMPAGSYTLSQVGNEPNIYELSNSSSTHSVVLETRQSSKTTKAKTEVVFNKYGDTDDLEAVLTPDTTRFNANSMGRFVMSMAASSCSV